VADGVAKKGGAQGPAEAEAAEEEEGEEDSSGRTQAQQMRQRRVRLAVAITRILRGQTSLKTATTKGEVVSTAKKALQQVFLYNCDSSVTGPQSHSPRH
jgi:hypothetical protein